MVHARTDDHLWAIVSSRHRRCFPRHDDKFSACCHRAPAALMLGPGLYSWPLTVLLVVLLRWYVGVAVHAKHGVGPRT